MESSIRRSIHITALIVSVLLNTSTSQAIVLYGNVADLGANSSHSPNFLLGSSITINQPVDLLSAGVIFRTDGYTADIGLYSSATVGGLPDQLLATTGAFNVTSTGVVETPFTTNPLLAPGNYWFMAVYNLQASVGITSQTSDLVAYESFNFSSTLPSTFGPAITYTGQAFNYYLVTQPVPEPSMSILAIGGFYAFLSGWRHRKRA
jgi:hypothetical protein